MRIILTAFFLLLSCSTMSFSFAATVPCLKMQANPGNVGDTIVATYDTCDAGDQPVPAPADGKNIYLSARFYHPEDDNGAVTADNILVGNWKSGMYWSDVADMCKGKCEGFTATHVQQKVGQICVKMIENRYNDATYKYSPAAGSCIVVGNECDFESQQEDITFPPGAVDQLNGATQGVNVSMQCGGNAEVRYDLKADASSQTHIDDDNEIEIYSGKDGNITGRVFMDNKPFSDDGIFYNEYAGTNSHEITVTLNVTGAPIGEHSVSFILVSEIQ